MHWDQIQVFKRRSFIAFPCCCDTPVPMSDFRMKRSPKEIGASRHLGIFGYSDAITSISLNKRDLLAFEIKLYLFLCSP